MTSSKEWFEKSEVDYYSAFIKLWLSFNAFYKRLYQINHLLKNDRQYIEELKANDNPIKRRFSDYFLSNDSNDASEFCYSFQELVRIYDGGRFGNKKIARDEERQIKPQMSGRSVNELSFSDFIHPKNYQLKNSNVSGYVKIGKLYIKNDVNAIWPYYVEITYMLRNQLVHGTMPPTEENHQIIRNCYIALRHLIKDDV